MSPKNKKKSSRRNNKHYKRFKTNPNNVEVKEQMSVTAQQNKKEASSRPSKNSLSIIEQVVNRLKENTGVKFIAILERLFSVYNAKHNKRVIIMELLSILLSNVKEYERDEIGALNVKLNSIFFPKVLKDIMIDHGDLREQINLFALLGFGRFCCRAVLNKNGRKIQVEITEADSTGDNLNVIQEAKILSQLRHENIVKILAFDKMGPRFATEYMKLGKLNFALEKYDFTSEKLLGLLKGVTSAMVYITERGYVLRDLSSENIQLDSNGKCKISSFRYCQYVGDTDGIYVDEDTDLENDISAPEVKEENRFSTKSDVWDMALLACEVFSVNPEKLSNILLPPLILGVVSVSMFLSNEECPLPYKCPYPLWYYFRTRLLDQDPGKRPTFPQIMEELLKYDDWQLD